MHSMYALLRMLISKAQLTLSLWEGERDIYKQTDGLPTIRPVACVVCLWLKCDMHVVSYMVREVVYNHCDISMVFVDGLKPIIDSFRRNHREIYITAWHQLYQLSLLGKTDGPISRPKLISKSIPCFDIWLGVRYQCSRRCFEKHMLLRKVFERKWNVCIYVYMFWT